jgi:hypothetical protein
MDAGELVALLVTFTLPGRDPVEEGVKVTFIVAVSPDFTICPDETPLAVYPAPVMVTFEIVTSELPPLVKTTGRTLLLPILTLEKFRAVWLTLRINVAAALTVSVAGLLVALPTPLVTVTVNSVPLSPVVVAGVVYEGAVAPPMAVPPFFH